VDSITTFFDFFRLLIIRRKYGFPYQNIAILSFIIFGFSASLLYATFVSQFLCLLIVGIASIGITLLFWKFYTKSFNIFWALFHNMNIGLLVLATYIHINSVFPKSTIEYKTYKVTDIQHKRLGKKNKNLTLSVNVKIEGRQKNLALSNGESKKILGTINNWKVKVGLQKGFFGHTVIQSVKAF